MPFFRDLAISMPEQLVVNYQQVKIIIGAPVKRTTPVDGDL